MSEPLDLERIRGRLAHAELGYQPNYHLDEDVAALIREVERLREELARRPKGEFRHTDDDL